MGINKLFGSGKPLDTRQEKAKREKLAEESPERALVADISRANNVYALGGAVAKVDALKSGTSLTQEQISGLKQEINRKQLKLLEGTLLAQADETGGYEFNYIFELKDTYKLIAINPNLNPEDKNQYVKLWQEKLEPRAQKIFKGQAEESDYAFQLRDIRGAVDDFPFTDEAKRAELSRLVDEKISKLSK